MQKVIEFYHNRGTNLLILECTLPILANMGLNKSTNYTFQLFCKNDKDLFEKKREDTTEGTFFVLIRNAIVDIIFKKKPQTSANQFLEDTQAYSNQTQCVKKCQYHCIRDESPRSIKENRELAFEIMFMFYR